MSTIPLPNAPIIPHPASIWAIDAKQTPIVEVEVVRAATIPIVVTGTVTAITTAAADATATVIGTVETDESVTVTTMAGIVIVIVTGETLNVTVIATGAIGSRPVPGAARVHPGALLLPVPPAP